MIKRGRSEVVSHTFYLDEVAADAGTVAVTVKNSDGSTVFTGPATKTDLVYSFTLPAQAELGFLDVTWDGSVLNDVSQLEVISDYYFEIASLKDLLKTRSLNKAYTNDFLRSIRDQVTEIFESVAHVSFVERRKTVNVSVSGAQAFVPVVPIREVVSVNGAAFSGTFTTYGGVSVSESRSAAITYEHGLDGGVTAEARGMALDLAVYLTGAQTRNTPDNASSVTDQNGSTYRLALPGTRDIQVAVPHVDAFLKRIRFDLPGVA